MPFTANGAPSASSTWTTGLGRKGDSVWTRSNGRARRTCRDGLETAGRCRHRRSRPRGSAARTAKRRRKTLRIIDLGKFIEPALESKFCAESADGRSGGAAENAEGGVNGRCYACTPLRRYADHWGGRTRTCNFPVNSRTVCQLTYTPRIAYKSNTIRPFTFHGRTPMANSQLMRPARRGLPEAGLARHQPPRLDSRARSRHRGVATGTGRHNIWELIVHCAYWKYAVTRLLTGAKRGSFPLEGSNFFARDGGSADDLQRDIRLLRRCHRDLLAAAARVKPRELAKRPPAGKKWTREQAIRGAACHDVYHAGQIQLIKRLRQGSGLESRGLSVSGRSQAILVSRSDRSRLRDR